MDKRKGEMMSTARLEAEVKELRKESAEVKQYILALQGEVYGARLAAKYLDKELAGRLAENYSHICCQDIFHLKYDMLQVILLFYMFMHTCVYIIYL